MSQFAGPRDDLECWLAHLARRTAAARRDGGDRLSARPAGARRFEKLAADSCPAFAATLRVSSPAWRDSPLGHVLAQQADSLVGDDDAVLVADETAVPKKGTHSVGAQRNTTATR